MKKKEKFFGLLGISAVSIMLFSSMCHSNLVLATTYAKAATADATITVKPTCSMTATIESGNEHTATIINGQYKENIGLTSIQTLCNDYHGYAIYAIGYTGGDVGVAAGTNTVLHSNALGGTYDITTGITTSGDTSSWAMKLAATIISGTYKPDILNGYDDYSIIPQVYTKVASLDPNIDFADPRTDLTATYAAYISLGQPAGVYEGQVKYVLVHPSSNLGPDYYYMQDVNEWGATIAVGQEITAYDSRDNKAYTVRRMCTSGAGSTWQEKEASCTDSTLWMTQNLDLDLNPSIKITSMNTDLNEYSVDSVAYSDSGGYYLIQEPYGPDTIVWSPSSRTVTDIDNTSGGINGWYNSNTAPWSFSPEGNDASTSWYTNGTYFQSSLCNTSNDQTCNYLKASNTFAQNYFQRIPFASNGSHGKVGNYYNWSAAIASNNSSSFATSTYYDTTKNPKNSICPRGWRLPIVSATGDENDFAKLNNIYNSIHDSDKADQGLFNAPVYMTRSGNISSNKLNLAGFNGSYWSSTVYNDTNADYLVFRSNLVITGTNNSRFFGWSIRCVSDY
ncbi:hypothetical protein IKF02_02075 [Candidatus Saccharibacteria bacterium]|nr:hypothetical protein [Candidatus Saccharibacteria bacterium]